MKKFLFLMLVTFYYVWGDTPVLVIHSYHESYAWTQKQHEGFVSVLNNAKNIYPLYSTEYLDTKRRTFDQAYEDEFVHYMNTKYKGYHPKLIYVTDDNALHFMLDNKNKLFPGVPVVFSGINDLSLKKIVEGKPFTGIFEKKEIIPNLTLIKTLFPKEDEVLILGDGSVTAHAIHHEVQRDIAAIERVNVRYVNEQKFDIVLEKLRSFKGKTIVLTTVGGFLTRDGNLIPLDEVINQIKGAGSFVIFSLEDTYIQSGVIGGYAVNGISEGSEAAKLALQILSTPNAHIPVINKNTNGWIFDSEVLEAQKINLPKEIKAQSIFLNLPETFFQKYQELFILLLYGLSATVIIGSLSYGWLMYRSRKIILQREKSLSSLSESLNRAQRIAHLGNWEWDIQANVLWWSDEIYRIFGLEPQQFQATYEGFLERVYPEDRNLIQVAVMNVFNDNTDYCVAHRIVKQDGTIRYVSEEGNLVRDDLGNPLKMIGIVHDITDEYEKEEALKLSEKKYKDLVEHAMIGVYRTNLSGTILYINQALAEMLSYDSPDELIGKNCLMFYPEPEQRAIMIQKLFKEESINNYEMEFLDKHSVYLPVMISVTIDGDILSGMIIDMREIKKSREEIEKFSKIVEQIDDLVVITDKAGKITYVNQAFLDYTGYVKDEVLGKTHRMIKSEMYDQEYYQQLWKVILNGEIFRKTIANKKKNGELFYEKKTITPLRDDKNDIVGFISTGKDVTQETLLYQEIERIATIDKLTGLYNRHKFEELFALEAERSQRFSLPLSMIMIDIDHFKSVNDTYGHDIGDEVLKHLAITVQENIRKIDIFARWGGEEFLVLCPGTDLEYTQKLAEKLRRAVEHASFPKIGHVTISLGVSMFKKKDTFSELFKRADDRLYYAKEHGRNQVSIST